MHARWILILVSVLGTTATLIVVTEGAWLYGLLLYGATVAGLLVMLRRVVGRLRGPASKVARAAPNQLITAVAAPPGVPSPHS